MKKEDYFIKDEGEFFTIAFMSEAAKKLIKTELPDPEKLYGDEVLKLDLMNESKNSFLIWALSHNLVGSEF